MRFRGNDMKLIKIKWRGTAAYVCNDMVPIHLFFFFANITVHYHNQSIKIFRSDRQRSTRTYGDNDVKHARSPVMAAKQTQINVQRQRSWRRNLVASSKASER